jgi:hypothetical protein
LARGLPVLFNTNGYDADKRALSLMIVARSTWKGGPESSKEYS